MPWPNDQLLVSKFTKGIARSSVVATIATSESYRLAHMMMSMQQCKCTIEIADEGAETRGKLNSFLCTKH